MIPAPSPARSPRRLLALVLVATALAFAACTSSSENTTTAPTDPNATTTAPGDTTTTTTAGNTTTTIAPTTSSSFPEAGPITPRVGEGVDPEVAEALAAELQELLEVTERVRGLPFLQTPDVAIVTPEELAVLVREDIEEELQEPAGESALPAITIDERWLALLGLMDEGTDLGALYQDLLAEQVLGFYDPETGELVIGGDGSDLSPLSRMTVIHELVHSLTDQHFSFGDYREQLLDEERFDEAGALLALIEGDATYFQLVYMQEELTLVEQLELAQEVLSADTSVLDRSPEFLQADLAFPYDQGFFFVESLVSGGGIAAVDAAYTDYPTTTEQILHPDRYDTGEGAGPVELPATPVTGYDLLEESVLGEWGLRLLWLEVESPDLVTQYADGWEGDAYRVFFDDDDVAFVLAVAAEEELDAIEMAQALLRLAEVQMGLGGGVDDGGGVLFATADGYAFVDRIGNIVYFVAASDPVAGAELRSHLPSE